MASPARVGLSVSFIQRPNSSCVFSTNFGLGTQTRKHALGYIMSVGCGNSDIEPETFEKDVVLAMQPRLFSNRQSSLPASDV